MKTKFYWHIHHDVLVEPLTEPIENRIDFIKQDKPKAEIVLRLKLLKPVKGKLPIEVVKAWEAHNKAEEAYHKVREAYHKAEEAYDKAWEAYDKAWEAYNEVLIKNKKYIEELHNKECPDCPWDGKSIFGE